MSVLVVLLRLKRLLLVCPLCLSGELPCLSPPGKPMPMYRTVQVHARPTLGCPAAPHPKKFKCGGLSARLLPPFDDMQNSDVIKCNHFLVPRAALTLNTTRYNPLRPTQNSVKAARTCPKTRHLYPVPGRQRTHVIISTALANLRSRERSSIVLRTRTQTTFVLYYSQLATQSGTRQPQASGAAS